MLAATALDELDQQLTSPAFFADPYPFYHRLREADPVHWSDANGGWMLTRYDDVLATLKDTRHFSSRGRFSAVIERIPPDVRARVQPLEDHFKVGLIASDPPDHTRMRALVNRAFTPRVVEQLRPRIQALVDGYLDAVQDRGEMDVVRDLAYPLPATVIAELLGAPPEDRDRFKRWTAGIMAFQGTGRVRPEVIEESQRALLEMRAFLTDLAEQRRRAPREDLMSRLVEAEEEGEKLTHAELMTTCVTLLTAGHETTTSLIGSGLYTLLRHPDQLRVLRERPDLMPSAIEEMLRYESPLQRNPRSVAADVELDGKRLRRGDYVMQVLGAANRDPAQFPEPDRFDVTRQPNRHVAFGFGIHFCVGASLARLEAPIAIESVLRRMPRLKLAVDHDAIRWHQHGLLRGLTSLPVLF